MSYEESKLEKIIENFIVAPLVITGGLLLTSALVVGCAINEAVQQSRRIYYALNKRKIIRVDYNSFFPYYKPLN